LGWHWSDYPELDDYDILSILVALEGKKYRFWIKFIF